MVIVTLIYEWRYIYKCSTWPLQWRHNELDGVSYHQPCDCLPNRLFRCRSKKHQSSASLVFVWGIHRWPVNSPHKWPVTRKMFPFDDVIMSYGWSVLVEQRICLNKETRFIGVSCFYQWTQFLVCVCYPYGTITKISLYDPYRMPHFPNRPDPTQWNGFPSRCWSGTLAKETEAYTMTKSCASNIISLIYYHWFGEYCLIVYNCCFVRGKSYVLPNRHATPELWLVDVLWARFSVRWRRVVKLRHAEMQYMS